MDTRRIPDGYQIATGLNRGNELLEGMGLAGEGKRHRQGILEVAHHHRRAGEHEAAQNLFGVVARSGVGEAGKKGALVG